MSNIDPSTPSNKSNKGKPGDGFIGLGFALGLLGVAAIIIGANSTDAYGYHTGPSPMAFLIFVIALVLAAIGFAKRLLAAVENRNH
jgi:membrane protein implicated in regulation of membrane protease activity